MDGKSKERKERVKVKKENVWLKRKISVKGGKKKE